MKRKLLTLITLVGIISISGCATSEDTVALSDDLTRITERYEMFEILEESMVSDSIKTLRANSDIRTPYTLLVN